MAAWRYEICLRVLKKYFTRSLRSLVKYFFQHKKRNFVSPRGHVISSMGETVLSVDMTRENELPYSLLHVIVTMKMMMTTTMMMILAIEGLRSLTL